MLFLTGDCHGDFRRFSTRNFPIQRKLTKSDLVVILGDAGLIWDGGRRDEWWMNWFESKSFSLVNIGGNHENYDILERYPRVRWHGGDAYQLRPSVFHLCRGYTFDLDGFNTFVMGGAQSHDTPIILNPAPETARLRQRLDRLKIPYRVHGRSWWPQELPSQSEHFDAWKTLNQERWSVELVLIHCAPNEIQEQLAAGYPTNGLTDFLQFVLEHLDYEQWFCGHYHQSKHSPERNFRVLNEEIIRIDENGGSHYDIRQQKTP